MSGFEWLSASAGSAGGASVLPVWAAGALAALLCFAGVHAFTRAARTGRRSLPWRVALLLVGGGLMWVVTDSLGGRDRSTARNVLEATLWHGGEAEGARQQVLKMSRQERQALIKFVESL